MVELLIVVAILAILSVAAISLFNPLSQLQKANDARRKSDLIQIQKALEIYYQDHGRYPPHYSFGDFRIKDLNGNPVAWGSAWNPYMATLPKDPSSSKRYVYYAISDGQVYYLYATLDRGGNDPQACNSGSACTSLTTYSLPNSACGTATDICNFGVSSSNVSP